MRSIINIHKLSYLLLIIFVTTNIPTAVLSQSIRKDYREFTDAERDAYLDAFDTLWDEGFNDIVEMYAQVHFDSALVIHGSEDDPQKPFLPWHRELLQQFELYLKDNNPDVTIPYWNWIEDQGDTADIWGNSWLGQYDNQNFPNVNYYFDLGRNLSFQPGSNFSFPDEEDLNECINQLTFPSFTSYLEHGPDPDGSPTMHDVSHIWIRSQMGTNFAPRDPVFCFSHGFIDKIWQDWYNTDWGKTATVNWIDAGGYIDTIMPCREGDIQFIDPDLIMDSRFLDVWYAYNNLTILDQYSVPICYPECAKTYKYTTGEIHAQENFIIPDSAVCTFEVSEGHSIVLKDGFHAEEGSQFLAKISSNVDLNRITVAVEEDETSNNNALLPTTHLESIYPNPFNPVTTIPFSLEVSGRVKLVVFNTLGKHVTTLIDNPVHEAGSFEVNFDASRLPSGLYFYRIDTKNYTQTRKMIFLK